MYALYWLCGCGMTQGCKRTPRAAIKIGKIWDDDPSEFGVNGIGTFVAGGARPNTSVGIGKTPTDGDRPTECSLGTR